MLFDFIEIMLDRNSTTFGNVQQELKTVIGNDLKANFLPDDWDGLFEGDFPPCVSTCFEQTWGRG